MGSCAARANFNKRSTSSARLRPLHVVLEHRNAKEQNAYLQYLENKKEGNSSNNLPTKLSIFSDFQWIHHGQIITGKQRQEVFGALSDICGNVRHLQIDLWCDLFLPDVEVSLDFDLETYGTKGDNEDNDDNDNNNQHQDESQATSTSEGDISSSTTTDSEAAELVQRLQVLPVH